MKKKALLAAINSSITSAESSDGTVKLLPVGAIAGADGRSWKNSDPEAVIQRTQERGVDLPVDIEHSSELKAPNGDPAPAQGWIKPSELIVDDGYIAAKIDWNSESNPVANREYRYLSPVFLFDPETSEVIALKSIGLTNRPNLPELGALNHENEKPNMDEILKLLGLSVGSSEQDVTTKIKRSLVRLEHNDQRGFESDTFTFTLNDPNAEIQLPRRGASLELWLGYFGQALIKRGSFTVDEVEVSNRSGVDQITVRCKAADMRKSLKAPKSKSWHKTNIGDVVTTIATNHKLEARVSDELSQIAIDHMDQSNESDLHFLTRLAKEHNAIAKPSEGKLLFVERGKGKTVSGRPLPVVNIQRKQTEIYDYTVADREQFDGVSAKYHDPKKAKTIVVDVGNDGNVKTLKRVYKSESEARNAANAALKAMKNGAESIDIDLPDAIPDLFAEMPAVLSDWRSEINGDGWIVDSVVTTLDERLSQFLVMERG